jgi:UDP-N-acetyl-D-glucosamine dehydrogenase
LSLESSTYPGTTKEIIINKLNSKFNIGKNFFVVYSPEREDPGSKFKLEKIPKIVSGYSKKCLIKAKKFYGLIFKELVSVSSLETAEMTKLLENIYRSVNIGLINEMKMISETFNVNIYEIIKAANTKPFGFQAFYPGPGVGGHCIPVDPFYLTWKAKKLGINTKFIKIAGKINDEITNWIIDKVNLIIKKKRKKLLVIGVAYKKNVDDYRESPILKIINKLEKRENIVDYYDPFIPVIKKTRKYNFNKRSSKLNFKKLSQYDAVIVGTDHDIIDYNNLRKYSKLIIDLRGRYSSIKAKKIICL